MPNELDPSVKDYFERVLTILPRHKFFSPTTKNPEGRPAALHKCRLTLKDFLAGKSLSTFRQAQLEFILALCQGRKLHSLVPVPHQELRHLVHGVKGLLQLRFYAPKPDQTSLGRTYIRLPQEVWLQSMRQRPFEESSKKGIGIRKK